MFLGQTYQGDTQRPLSDRVRLIAMWAGVMGLTINCIIFAMFSVVGLATSIMFVEVLIYNSILVAVLISAMRRRYLRLILNYGLLAMWCVFWISAFLEARFDHMTLFDLPLILFVPLFLVIIFEYRWLFALSGLQAACVFVYSSQFAVPMLSPNLSGFDQTVFSVLMAAFSGVSFCVLGVVALARERADRTMFQLISEKQALASTDGLTGLMNRRAFIKRLRAQWPLHATISIAFIDLDHFKPLNDQYGHAVGDQILCAVAERLGDVSHVSATARLGGDEFAVLFEAGLDDRTLARALDELHTSLTADLRSDAGLISIGASIGCAEGNTLKQTLSGLLRSADTAMRRAKSTRQDWAQFDPKIDNAAIATTTLEFELKAAIHNGQIKAAIQPIANAKTRDIQAYELLARWTDSGFERDPSPNEFIPIAEKLGLLNELLWVTLDEALAYLDLDPVQLAINVSPAQLLATDFLDTLLTLLERHCVDPSLITIEITEEVAFRNVERNIAVLNQARALGFTIALDDFGTGYSSLSMLDTLPLDKLKIDQSFVRKSDQSQQSKRILLAAIRLAKQLELESCVEGIETQKLAARVAVLGADHIQGYWIGRPQLVRDAKHAIKLAS